MGSLYGKHAVSLGSKSGASFREIALTLILGAIKGRVCSWAGLVVLKNTLARGMGASVTPAGLTDTRPFPLKLRGVCFNFQWHWSLVLLLLEKAG